ncbi:DUF692 family multinuclear iron-containing protein [Oceanobacillus chungangensis]|uniref:DUF692 domain-containing protein n=1 Tax=Oceanobacillus chungangensis TaxID=1229152 RepID=A0A3D8Q0E1_9BACI|nr:DUF692 family multinuclear iron-containing protein [Oceanobacillus chungangensis]RDW20435.1 hypothetical protein CWR45_04145 [Oceanobacillus chungangensis]
MKFAMNYSVEAKQLVDEGIIDIDLFKCPDFDRQVICNAREARPAYVHFALYAGKNNLNQVEWKIIDDLRNNTATPFVNLHMVAYSEDYPRIEIASNDPKHLEQVLETVVHDIELVTNRFGADNVILENVIYRPDGNTQQAITKPELITRIIRETNCGLLLDLAHAQMTSRFLGVEVYDYINQLPLDALRELHVTGIQRVDNKLYEHMPLSDANWQLVEWAMENIKQEIWPEPWVVSYEYGGVGPKLEWRSESKVMEEQVPRLYALMKESQPVR